jgi:dimeric dUTPase (all-alpha-NTP-PPase superfamily)
MNPSATIETLESDLTHFINSLETVLSVANAAVPDSISQMDLFHQFRNHCGI